MLDQLRQIRQGQIQLLKVGTLVLQLTNQDLVLIAQLQIVQHLILDLHHPHHMPQV